MKDGFFDKDRGERQDPAMASRPKGRLSFSLDVAVVDGLKRIADSLSAQGVVTTDGRTMNVHALGVQVLTDFVRGVESGRREIDTQERTVRMVDLSDGGSES